MVRARLYLAFFNSCTEWDDGRGKKLRVGQKKTSPAVETAGLEVMVLIKLLRPRGQFIYTEQYSRFSAKLQVQF